MPPSPAPSGAPSPASLRCCRSASGAPIEGWLDLLSRPTTFFTFAAIIVPIGVMWVVALLAWRAEELRLRSSTMTEVAIRLAEPDRLAEQSAASLGQAVRRQVRS